jgi:hypothetical protein
MRLYATRLKNYAIPIAISHADIRSFFAIIFEGLAFAIDRQKLFDSRLPASATPSRFRQDTLIQLMLTPSFDAA